MMERSLEEIARGLNGDVPAEVIDAALDEAGLDCNDIERERFRRLLSENTAVILNIDDYRASAAAAAGPAAPDSEITAIAWNMKEDGIDL